MKKTLLISFAALFLALAIAIPIVVKIRNNKTDIANTNEKNKSIEQNAKLAKTLENVVEYNGDIPEFSIKMTGLYSATVTSEEIKEKLPIYEFEAGVYDMYDAHTSKYVGVKYWDLIKYLKLPHNESAVFKSNRKSVSYRPTEIDYDKTFIVFLRDGKPIGDGKAALLAINYSYSYSVENLEEIHTN